MSVLYLLCIWFNKIIKWTISGRSDNIGHCKRLFHTETKIMHNWGDFYRMLFLRLKTYWSCKSEHMAELLKRLLQKIYFFIAPLWQPHIQQGHHKILWIGTLDIFTFWYKLSHKTLFDPVARDLRISKLYGLKSGSQQGHQFSLFSVIQTSSGTTQPPIQKVSMAFPWGKGAGSWS
jgi:hypothetical protein